MKIYYNDEIQAIENNIRIIEAESDFEMQKAGAKFLGISLEEFQDFERDMMFNTTECTPEEIEQMYVEYCMEYDIPCQQIPDYACYDRMGWL